MTKMLNYLYCYLPYNDHLFVLTVCFVLFWID